MPQWDANFGIGALVLPIAALMFALGIVMTPAAARSPAEFYKGKTITIMLGDPPGGSYDLHGLPHMKAATRAIAAEKADKK